MQNDTPHDMAEDALETLLKEVHRESMMLMDDHWQAVMAAEKNVTEWKEKSRLQVSVFRKGNHIQLKWIAVMWFGRGDSRRPVRESIAKTNEFGYTKANLSKYAQQWELPLIEATEKKLTSLRKQAHFLVQSKMALRNARIEAERFKVAPSETEAHE